MFLEKRRKHFWFGKKKWVGKKGKLFLFCCEKMKDFLHIIKYTELFLL